MKPRFLADNNLNRDIVRGLVRRNPNIDLDARHLHGVVDEAVLELALRSQRLLLSHDIRTIPPLFDSLRPNPLPGVFLVLQSYPVGAAIDQLELVWEASEFEEWQNRLISLKDLKDFVR